jgi:nitrogen fixation/metabolism regulation signal transduction histidine kinase
MPKRRRRMRWETQIVLFTLAGGLPASILATLYLAHAVADPSLRGLILTALWLSWLICAGVAVERAVRPMQTLSNMVAAIREGDTSIRARGADPEGALGLALWEVNALTEAVRRQRLGAIAATALLRRVMDSVDVAVFGFDPERRLRLVNGEGERLLGRPSERLLGLEAQWLGLGTCLEGETPRLVDLRLAGASGRWELRRGQYIQDGRPQELVFLSDLSRALREEEREAWQRLIRVLSHEINNSLAPIQSIAGSLRSILERGESSAAPAELSEGLDIIETRSRSLARFMHAYARLARLPKPTLATVDAGGWVRRVAALETRLAVEVVGGPEVTLHADGDQLEQLLINLVRNAVDAALETHGRVWLEWSVADDVFELRVLDEGPGLVDTANLFVPFFTTKPAGTGIGLALSRQIAEAHGGTLVLENRGGDSATKRRPGCTAIVRLPVGHSAPGARLL